MAARIGALVLAIAMVVGAIALRSRIDRSRTTARLTCATELEAACHALGHGLKVTIEPAGVTADRLIKLDDGADPGLDGWMTPGPWSQIVDAERRVSAKEPIFGDKPAARLAQTRLTAVVATRRVAECPAPTTWECVGSRMAAAPQSADIPDPGQEATGPLVLAAVAPGSIDDPLVQQRLPSLKTVKLLAGDDAVSDVLTTNGADLSLVATLDAVAAPVIAQAANRNSVAKIYPSPVATVEVVLGIAGSGKAADRAREVAGGDPATKALREAGWDALAGSGPSTDPGLIAALRAEWNKQR